MTRHKIWLPRSLVTAILIICMQLGWIEAKPSTSLEDETNSLKCLLRKVPPEPCVKLTGYMLPRRLIQLYESMGEEIKESIKAHKNLGTLKPDVFATFPSQLFLLIPSEHLNPVSATSLTALLKNNLHDLAVTIKIIRILNVAKAEEFFSKLEGVGLPYRVQDKIAETLVKWLPDVKSNWTFPRFRMVEQVGDPLIAHIPPHFIANLSQSEAIRFLFHLRNWLWLNLPKHVWNGKLASAKRVWADTMIRSSYPVNIKNWTEGDGRRFRYLLEGATPDELKLLTSDQLQDSKLFRSNLSKLQVRTLFSVMYPNANLTSANLTEELLPVALQLSPENLQKFNITSTDFKVLSTMLPNKCSYSTSLQILESLVAQAVFAGRLESVRTETWGDGIEHLGKFIYVLPPSALLSYRLNTPSLIAQSSIDSDKLSQRQARLLTGEISVDLEKPDVMLGKQGLLKALPSAQIANRAILPQTVLSHLLSNLPSGSPMQTATLLLKVGKLKGKIWALENILSNKNPNQYFELLDSPTLTNLEADIRELKGFDNAIGSLPQNTLSALLTSQRTKLAKQNVLWSSDSLLSEENQNLLLGLSCNDIYAMETVDFINILQTYNKKRKLLNKPFPKDLQYCSQMALITYLEMKASLQDDRKLNQLLDYLEPSELEVVGGYILGNLPIEGIKKSKWKHLILETIGQLSLPELIVATKEENPKSYAKLLINHYALLNHDINIKELFGMGNLFQFMSSDDIMKINQTSFKLFLESLGDSRSRAVCADSSTRSAWYQLILKSFGDPFKWTAGVLETLGDMLVVVPHTSLLSVPEESWKEAVDVLIDKTSYHLKYEWPGNTEHISFFQACAELLDTSEVPHYVSAVRDLVRWYLSAVHDQLNTVMTASHLLSLTHRAMKGRADKGLIKDFSLETLHPESVVKILDVHIDKPVTVDKSLKEHSITEMKVRQNADINPIKQSGEVLRSILETNQILTKANGENQTTTEPGIDEVNPIVKPQVRKLGKPWEKISCNVIKAAGPVAAIPLDETDIERMETKELEDCLETLGSLELDKSVQHKIWNSVSKDEFFENLSDLGYLVKVIDVNDVTKINLNLRTSYALDNLAILSRMVTDMHVLQEIAQHFVRSNPDLKVLTTEITIALGRILCEVVELKSQKLHEMIGPSVFLRASPVLGQMKNCPTHCLHKLAHTAVKTNEYGPPSNWTAEDVATLGIIAAGLKTEQWKQLRSTGYGNNPLVGLQPMAVKYIPPQIFKELNEDQLKSLPTLSAAVVSEEQISHLSESQHQALTRVQKEVPVVRHSSDNEIAYEDQTDSSLASLPVRNLCLLIVVLAVMFS